MKECKNAFLLNIALNCARVRLNSSWTAVVFATKVAVRAAFGGGTSHNDMVELLGIQSQKKLEFLARTLYIVSSTSRDDKLAPR